MEKIIEINEANATIVKSDSLESIPDIVSQGSYQAVIVHADRMETIFDKTDLSILVDKLYENRLIEARFFNETEEHRILRTTINGNVQFLYRHLKDKEESAGEVNYEKSFDTTADYYKDGGYILKIRNYIKKRGLLNSCDDMRFVQLEKK